MSIIKFSLIVIDIIIYTNMKPRLLNNVEIWHPRTFLKIVFYTINPTLNHLFVIATLSSISLVSLTVLYVGLFLQFPQLP